MWLSRRRFLGAGLSLLALPRVGRAMSDVVDPYFPTLEALDDSLRRFSISPADKRMLLGLARPTAILSSAAMPDADIPLGQGKIGGAPDIPPGMIWPEREGYAAADNWAERAAEARKNKKFTKEIVEEYETKAVLAARPAPLIFLMQIDLAACAAAGPMDLDIPKTGRLLLFYDFVFDPGFGEQEQEKAFRLIYLSDEAQKLERRVIPDFGLSVWGDLLPPEQREGEARQQAQQLPPALIHPKFTYTLPHFHSYPMMVNYPYPEDMPHLAWYDRLQWPMNDGCQLFGWPELVQYSPAIDLGMEDVNAPHYYDLRFIPQIRQLAKPIANWIPLVSIMYYDNDSVDFNGGYYVMIRRTDLRNGDFSKAVIVFQTD